MFIVLVLPGMENEQGSGGHHLLALVLLVPTLNRIDLDYIDWDLGFGIWGSTRSSRL